ncbi:hypothetical protein CYK37_14620 [Mesorhizobium loti]|nr:hypothetical protein CYK37_14620 [Mesorhizobium loti]
MAFATGPTCAGEDEAWTDQISGIVDISGAGPVRYTVGYSSIGYDHFRSEIAATWHDDGDRTQTIYDGIYDNPPAKVWSVGRHLCVSMEACVRYEDVCTTSRIAYRYDIRTKSFAELPDGESICRW